MYVRTLPTLVLLLALNLTTHLALGQEVEPNNDMAHASPIVLDKAYKGTVNAQDSMDFYQLTLTQSGIVGVELSGDASDCTFQVLVAGFQKYDSVAGWVDSKPGEPVVVQFSAQGGKPGYVGVRLTSAVAMNRSPIRYTLTLTLQPVPDPWEPNYEAGERKEDLLKKGLIRTIPVGREITAYLFNEYPAFMRSQTVPNGQGGENDVDLYHVRLDSPDTVRVALRDLPKEANSRILLFYPGGWKGSEPGQFEVEAEVQNAGDLFIEVSPADRSKPEPYGMTPYHLIVTTQSVPEQKDPKAPVSVSSGLADLTTGLSGEYEFEPFPDEAVAIQRLLDAPSDAHRKALADLRCKYAVALALEARRVGDDTMYARALHCAEGAVEVVTDDLRLWIMLGRLYVNLDENPTALSMAIDAFEEAIKIDDANVNARLLLGQALFQRGSYAAAIKQFETVMRMGTQVGLSPPVLGMMCLSYTLDFRPDAGESFFRGLISGNPAATTAHMALAVLLAQQGRQTEAVAELKQVVGRRDTSQTDRTYAIQLIVKYTGEGAL